MRKTLNRETISGRVYDYSQLAMKKVESKESKNFGQEYIGGSIDIATDDACLNIVTVYFTFVQPTYKSGKSNNSFGVLKTILDSGKSVVKDGAENATMVKVDASLALNDFYTQRNGEEVLVSAKRNNGSFISLIDNEKKLGDESTRSKFEYDFLITGTQFVEKNEERHIDKDYLIVKGYAFAFNGAILPADLIVKSEGGIKYFEGLDASPKNPTFTKVWGVINSETIVDKREEESAFGEPAVKEYTKTVREWVITGTAKPDATYPLDDAEAGITADDMKKAMADRETYLADVKRRADEYRASKDSLPFGETSAPAAAGGFNF